MLTVIVSVRSSAIWVPRQHTHKKRQHGGHGTKFPRGPRSTKDCRVNSVCQAFVDSVSSVLKLLHKRSLDQLTNDMQQRSMDFLHPRSRRRRHVDVNVD